MEKGFLFACFLTLISALVTLASSDFTVRRDEVKIKLGQHNCISNCSHMSSKENVPLVCSVDECGILEESENTAQKSEVEKADVYFERYTNETENKDRLALHFKWSPVDNASIDKTKGYLIKITDGEQTYSACYNITTELTFHQNKKDLFYNDCFGKADGTEIKLGSTIVVEITTLPLWKHGDSSSQMIRFKVEVPDCAEIQKDELDGFEKCRPAGGRPTMKKCQSHCHTYSENKGKTHPINCTLSQWRPSTISGKEKCDDVKKTVTGSPSKPVHLEREQEWYKYKDSEDGSIKIALNFSWTPGPDSSLEHLHGYYLEITAEDLIYYNKCYSVHTNLTEKEHSKIEFYHDCYGRTRTAKNIKPGDIFHIHLNSLPENSERTTFVIKVPECGDKRVEDVEHCETEGSKNFEMNVDEIFCQNRSLKFTYRLSGFGDYSDVVFCQSSKQPLRACTGGPIQRMENIAANNTLYNISLSSDADLSLNYTIYAHGSSSGAMRKFVRVNFSECLSDSEETSESMLIILILVVGILCTIGLLFLVCFLCKKDCDWKVLLMRGRQRRYVPNVSNRRPSPVVIPVVPPPVELELWTPDEPAVIPHKIRVYVVFLDVHELHRDVVHWFCAYLKEDLGLDVRVSIWEESVVAVNQIEYMNTNIKKAEKVVVICSEGTRDCLNDALYDGNMFTPVVRSICQQTFIGQSPGKYLVGFFDYSNQYHVPELLHEQCMMYFSLFKLMKQFEQFYFRLVGVEQYQEGGIQRIEKIAFDRYYDPSLTSCGKQLKSAIERMSAFARENPTWYADKFGSDQSQATLPPQPISRMGNYSITEDKNILDQFNNGQASISHIHAAPPPGLHDGEARPKLQNMPPQPPLTQQQQRTQYPSQPPPKAGKYQQLTSTTSTESSFILEPETEESSISPSTIDSPAQQDGQDRYHYPPRRQSSDLFASYHPDSFQETDFSLDDNSNLLSNIPSNETQITRIGLTPSMEQLHNANGMMSPFLSVSEDDEGTVEEESEEQPQATPESGVFTLANIDENDDEDFEDAFKSINFQQE